MKPFSILTFLLMVLYAPFFVVQAQETFSCEKIFIEYYQSDSIRPITNLEAFCKGAKTAFKTPKLTYKMMGEQFQTRSCLRYAYEQQNIELIFEKKTTDPLMLDEFTAYNFVAKKRISKKIGKKAFQQLGEYGPMYFGPEDIFSELFYDYFNNSLKIKDAGNNQIKIKLGKRHLFTDYMDDIKVIDRRTEKEFLFKDLFEGIVLSIDAKDKKDQTKLLSFRIDDFEHEYYCKPSAMPNAYIVWVRLKDFFNKKKKKKK